MEAEAEAEAVEAAWKSTASTSLPSTLPAESQVLCADRDRYANIAGAKEWLRSCPLMGSEKLVIRSNRNVLVATDKLETVSSTPFLSESLEKSTAVQGDFLAELWLERSLGLRGFA